MSSPQQMSRPSPRGGDGDEQQRIYGGVGAVGGGLGHRQTAHGQTVTRFPAVPTFAMDDSTAEGELEGRTSAASSSAAHREAAIAAPVAVAARQHQQQQQRNGFGATAASVVTAANSLVQRQQQQLRRVHQQQQRYLLVPEWRTERPQEVVEQQHGAGGYDGDDAAEDVETVVLDASVGDDGFVGDSSSSHAQSSAAIGGRKRPRKDLDRSTLVDDEKDEADRSDRTSGGGNVTSVGAGGAGSIAVGSAGGVIAGKRRRKSASSPGERNLGGGGETVPSTTTRSPKSSKMSPALAQAHRAADSATRRHQLAEADLVEAEKAVEAARDRVASARTEVERTGEALFLAQLDEPSKWNDMYRKMDQYKQRFGHCKSVPPRLRSRGVEWEKLGNWIQQQRRDYKRPAEKGYNALKQRPYRIEALNRLGFVWDQKMETWMEHYNELLDFIKEHGHAFVHRDYDAKRSRKGRGDEGSETDGDCSEMERQQEDESTVNVAKLGKWCQFQRDDYARRQQGRRSAMTDERLRLLEEVNFPFDLRNERWMVNYQQLVAYHEKYGDFFVPSEGAACSNVTLGNWVATLRKHHRYLREGKPSTMLDAERIKLLDDIGFQWNSDQVESTWRQQYKHLVDYHSEFGNTKVPDEYQRVPSLPTWVQTQKKMYWLWKKGDCEEEGGKGSGRSSSMTRERAELLEKLGFATDHDAPPSPPPSTPATSSRSSSSAVISRDDRWKRRYEELVAFHARYGDCFVTSADKHDKYFQLGNWVLMVRRQYKLVQEGKESKLLNADRIRSLDDLDFAWATSWAETKWRQQYHKLVDYKQEHGDTKVLEESLPGYAALCKWVRTQKHNYWSWKENGDHESRCKVLEAIGFHVDHAPPSGYSTTPKSKANRRIKCFSNTTADSNLDLVNPGVQNGSITTTGRLDSRWRRRYDQLVAYHAAHGDCLVPYEGPNCTNPALGNWVQMMRRHYDLVREGKPSKLLDNERMKLLDRIDFRT